MIKGKDTDMDIGKKRWTWASDSIHQFDTYL